MSNLQYKFPPRTATGYFFIIINRDVFSNRIRKSRPDEHAQPCPDDILRCRRYTDERNSPLAAGRIFQSRIRPGSSEVQIVQEQPQRVHEEANASGDEESRPGGSDIHVPHPGIRHVHFFSGLFVFALRGMELRRGCVLRIRHAHHDWIRRLCCR